MGETNLQKNNPTSITEIVDPDRLVQIAPRQHFDFDEARPSEEFFVRVRKNQQSVTLTLNTSRMVERREIERSNELKRTAGY